MKQTFYLDLTQDGVRLRLVRDDGARDLGQVALDDPDLATRLDALRRTGEAAAGGGFSAVVVLPRSEVLFTTVALGHADPERRRAQVRAELDGLTPYAVDELVFDARPVSDTEMAVAVVARETLQQAESFALAHGFAPQSFTTEPTPDNFEGRPEFGPTTEPASGGAPKPSDPLLVGRPESAAAPGGFHEVAAPPPLKVVEGDGPRDARSRATRRTEAEIGSEDGTAGPGSEDRTTRLSDIASRIALMPAAAGKARADRPRPPSGPSQPTGRGPAAPTPVVHRIAPPEEIDAIESLTHRPAAGAPSVAPPERHDDPGEPPSAGLLETHGKRRGGPRAASYLPLLVGLAVALVVALAIWGAFLLFAPGEPSPDADRAAIETPETAPPVETAAPTTATAEPPLAAPEPETGEPAATVPDAAPATPAASDPLDRPAGSNEANRYAATGIDTAAPDDPAPAGIEPPDDPAIPADPVPDGAPTIAPLPAPGSTEPDPTTLAPPPAPAGTPPADDPAFADVRVTEGAPPVAPPAPPGRTAPDVPPATDAATLPPPEPSPQLEPLVPVTDGPPPVAPPGRPGDLSATPPIGPEVGPGAVDVATGDADAGETEIGAVADAPVVPGPVDAETATEIAQISPQPRPSVAGEPADGDIAAAEADVAEAATLLPGDDDATGADPVSDAESPYALARSPVPLGRPAELGNRSVATARAPPAAAAPAPTTAPAVGRGDTMTFGQVNLIGVYGTEANRRALVRLPNGRFVKVQAGDRVDGGRIRQISGSALTYEKSGRAVTLRMP